MTDPTDPFAVPEQPPGAPPQGDQPPQAPPPPPPPPGYGPPPPGYPPPPPAYGAPPAYGQPPGVPQYPQQYPQAYPQQYPQGYPPQYATKTNTLAIIALIASMPFLCPLAGLVMGIIARGQINRTGEGGSGLALAAIIVSSVSIALGVVLVLAGVLGDSSPGSPGY